LSFALPCNTKCAIKNSDFGALNFVNNHGFVFDSLTVCDSAKFAPQLHKKLALEIKLLALQVNKSDEDQRLEVARQ